MSSSAPPTKRRRLSQIDEEAIDQLTCDANNLQAFRSPISRPITETVTIPPINLSTNQSKYQTHNLLTQVLLPDLFSVVCTFLSLPDKLTRLPMLSSSVSRLFCREIHCRNDTLVINQSMSSHINRVYNSFFNEVDARYRLEAGDQLNDQLYIRSALQSVLPPVIESFVRMIDIITKVELCVQTHPSNDVSPDDDFVQLAVARQTSVSRALKSLHFVENITYIDENDEAVRLEHLATAVAQLGHPKNLEKLAIRVNYDVPRNIMETQEMSLPWVDLRVFMRSSALHTLDLDFISFQFNALDDELDMFRSMPSSLTHLKFALPWETHEDQQYILPLLADPKWLPRIRHLEFVGMPIYTCPELLTIMTETSKPRPYEWLQLIAMDHTLSHDSFAFIEHLSLQVDYDTDVKSVFDQMGSSSFPLLKSFSVECYCWESTVSCDINPTIMFASRRPVEQLKVRLISHRALPWVPLSNDTLKAMSLMPLKSLDLDVPYSIDLLHRPDGEEAAHRLLFSRCWSSLKTLRLKMRLNVDTLTSILVACPAVRDIMLSPRRDDPCCPFTCLFLMSQHCSFLSSINLTSSQDMSMSMPLTTIQNTNMSFPHLKKLHLGFNKCEGKPFHLLISKLVDLSIVSFRLTESLVLHPLLYFIQRKLSATTNDIWLGRSATKTTLLTNMIRELSDGSIFPYTLVDSMIAKFHDNRDEQGRTGRDAFFESLFESLLPTEKLALNAWDQGNYDVVDVVLSSQTS